MTINKIKSTWHFITGRINCPEETREQYPVQSLTSRTLKLRVTDVRFYPLVSVKPLRVSEG